MKIYGYWKRGGEKGFFAHTAQIAILGYQGRGIEESADHSGTRGSAFLFSVPAISKGDEAKQLFNKTGQTILEYFILFVLFASIFLLSVATVFPRLRTAGETFFQEAAGRIRE